MKCAHCRGTGEIATPKLPFGKPIKRSTVKARKQAAHRVSTSEIRAKVVERAKGDCECGCGLPFTGLNPPELDHAHGGVGRRREQQSDETCWLLRRDCHRFKTANMPNREGWRQKWIVHCDRYGYPAAPPRLTKTIARAR